MGHVSAKLKRLLGSHTGREMRCWFLCWFGTGPASPPSTRSCSSPGWAPRGAAGGTAGSGSQGSMVIAQLHHRNNLPSLFKATYATKPSPVSYQPALFIIRDVCLPLNLGRAGYPRGARVVQRLLSSAALTTGAKR